MPECNCAEREVRDGDITVLEDSCDAVLALHALLLTLVANDASPVVELRKFGRFSKNGFDAALPADAKADDAAWILLQTAAANGLAGIDRLFEHLSKQGAAVGRALLAIRADARCGFLRVATATAPDEGPQFVQCGRPRGWTSLGHTLGRRDRILVLYERPYPEAVGYFIERARLYLKGARVLNLARANERNRSDGLEDRLREELRKAPGAPKGQNDLTKLFAAVLREPVVVIHDLFEADRASTRDVQQRRAYFLRTLTAARAAFGAQSRTLVFVQGIEWHTADGEGIALELQASLERELTGIATVDSVKLDAVRRNDAVDLLKDFGRVDRIEPLKASLPLWKLPFTSSRTIYDTVSRHLGEEPVK